MGGLLLTIWFGLEGRPTILEVSGSCDRIWSACILSRAARTEPLGGSLSHSLGPPYARAAALVS